MTTIIAAFLLLIFSLHSSLRSEEKRLKGIFFCFSFTLTTCEPLNFNRLFPSIFSFDSDNHRLLLMLRCSGCSYSPLFVWEKSDRGIRWSDSVSVSTIQLTWDDLHKNERQLETFCVSFLPRESVLLVSWVDCRLRVELPVRNRYHFDAIFSLL